MKIRDLLVLVAGLIIFCRIGAQPVSTPSSVLSEVLLESIASELDESGDYEAILQELELLLKNPLDLNNAKREQLQKLVFLTEFQINAILDYRSEKGNFLSIYEIQFVHGFTREVIEMLLPFITVSGDRNPVTLSNEGNKGPGRHEVSLRSQRMLEKSHGYTVYDSAAGDMRYPGNPWLINARYGFEIKNRMKAGFTVEKDPGEDLFRASNKHGFDFNSAYVMVEDIGLLKSAIFGDYRVAFGQGLTLLNGTAPGKSSLPLNIVKRQDAIKAFSSNDENNFFRGLAAGTSLGRFTLTAFFSSKKRDANITDTLSSQRIYFSSFQESGYHRTRAEISDEKAVRETVFGGNILFRNNFMKLGSTLVSYKLDKYLEKGDDPEDIHDFSGNRLLNWGVDYSIVLKKLQLFGETSYGNQCWATIDGILLNVNKQASFSILYRNFSRGYFSMHSSAFSEGSGDSNEQGIYAGLVLRPFAGFKISGYADFYHFPWPKFGLSAPASGSDYLLQLDYAPKKDVDIYVRLKYESDPEDEDTDSQVMPEPGELQHTGIRCHISYRINSGIIMQNRFEMINSDPGSSSSSQGFLLYHDAEYRPQKLPLVLDFRLAWFHTNSYGSRIYAYEQDMTSGFSFSPLYDHGCRFYLMAAFDITPHLSGAIRFASTYFFEKETIGSGSDAIDSHSRNDIKLRLAIRF